MLKTLFDSEKAICPKCGKKNAYGGAFLQDALEDDKLGGEYILCIIDCKESDCGKKVGFGIRLVDGNPQNLDTDSLLELLLKHHAC